MSTKYLKTFFIISFLLLVVLRVPSLFEPKWYGDEGVYAALGHHINGGKVLYLETWDHKPPLVYWIYTLTDYFGENNQFAVRLLNLGFSVLASILLFKLVKQFVKKGKLSPKVPYISAILLNLALATPVFEANIANAENFFIVFTLAGVLFALKRSWWQWLLGGIFFGLSVLTKIPPVFELFGVLFFVLITGISPKKRVVPVLKKFIWIGVGVALPWVFASLYFAYKEALYDFVFASFLFGIFYVKDAGVTWIIPNIIQNTMLMRCGLLGVTLLVSASLWAVGKIKRSIFFGVVWFGCAVFATTLSTRPYPHYVLQAIPPFVFLLSVLLGANTKSETASSNLCNYRVWFTKIGGFLVCSWFLLNVFTNWNPYRSYNPGNYYQLFWKKYVTKSISSRGFNNAFDWRVNNGYDLKYFLQDNYPEAKNVFVYDSFPWLFDIADIYSPVRFVTSYHIFWQDWHRQATIGDLENTPPDLVLVKDDVSVDEWFGEYLENNFVRMDDYAEYRFYVIPTLD